MLYIRHCGGAEINRLRPGPPSAHREQKCELGRSPERETGFPCSSNIIFNVDSARVKDLLIPIHSLRPSKIYLNVHILLPSPRHPSPPPQSVRKDPSGCLLMIDGLALSLYLLAGSFDPDCFKMARAVSMWCL